MEVTADPKKNDISTFCPDLERLNISVVKSAKAIERLFPSMNFLLASSEKKALTKI